MLLSAYRACAVALAALAPAFLWARGWATGKGAAPERRRRAAERLGRLSSPRPRGRLALMAAATAGEAAALRPLIDRLAAAGFHVLVTTRDEDAPRPRLPPFALHAYAPLDAPDFVAAFLSTWRPDVVLLTGAELWPVLIAETRRRGLPLSLVDGRLGACAFALLRLAPKSARALLAGLEPCLARSAEDGERLRRLGAARVQCAGDPVYDLAPEPADAAALAHLAARVGARPAWAALVADEAEADLAIEAHRIIAGSSLAAMTILAPRRARSAPALAARAKARGVGARVADAADPVESPAVQGMTPAMLIWPGDAAALLRATGLVFFGRSTGAFHGFLDAGRNPVEAAKLGCAILHGAQDPRFAQVYEALDEAGGASLVEDATSLAARILELLGDVAAIRAMGRAAAQEAAQRSGACALIMQALASTLAQIYQRPGVEDEADV